jgi:hypothetical protein
MASCRRAGATNERTRASPLRDYLPRQCYTYRHCRNASFTDRPVRRAPDGIAAAAIKSATRHCSASAVCCGPSLVHVIEHHGPVCSHERALRTPSFRNYVYQQLRLQLPVRAAELCATVPLLPDRAISEHIGAIVAPVPAGTICACEPDHRLSFVLGTILQRLEHWLRLCARQQLERPQLQLRRHKGQRQSSC